MFINSDLNKTLMISTLTKFVEWYKKAIQYDVKSRDTRYLMSLLARLPQIDQNLFLSIHFRKQAAYKFRYSIKFPQEIIPSDAEKKQLNEMKLRFEKSKMHTLIDVTMNGRLIGASAAWLQWGHDDALGDYVINKESLPPADLDYDLADDDKLAWVDTDTATQNATRKSFDKESVFLYRYNPMSGLDNDFPGGFIRINMLLVLLKYWDLFSWSKKNERSLTIAQYEEKYANRISEIIAQLNNIADTSAGAFPKGVDVKQLELLQQAQIDSHVQFQALIDKTVALTICGQTGAGDSTQGGSLAKAKVGYDIAADVTSGDLAAIEREITAQYIMQDYILNYKEPKNAYPEFVFLDDRGADTEKQSRIVSDYFANGIPVSVEDTYDKCGLIRPGDGVEVINPDTMIRIPKPKI